MEKGYPIGTLARQAGVKPVTIRYYERIGLLPPPERTEGNYRLYDATALKTLHFIRHCRGLGFSLDEIRALCALAGQAEEARPTIAAMAQARLRHLQEERQRIEAQCARLEALIRECPHGSISGCGIIDGLNGEGE